MRCPHALAGDSICCTFRHVHKSHFSERDVEMEQERVSADYRGNNLAKVESKYEINTMEGKIKDVCGAGCSQKAAVRGGAVNRHSNRPWFQRVVSNVPPDGPLRKSSGFIAQIAPGGEPTCCLERKGKSENMIPGKSLGCPIRGTNRLLF